MFQKLWVNDLFLPPLLEQYISITNGNELDAWLKKDKPTNKPCGEIPSPLPTTRNASNHKWNDAMKQAKRELASITENIWRTTLFFPSSPKN